MNCRTCLGEFTPSDRGGQSRYCSSLCRRKKDLEAYHRRASTSKRRCTCKHCGNEYTPRCANRNQFCSRDCAFSAQTQRTLHIPHSNRPFCTVHFPTCRQCGKQFAVRYANVRLCSDTCARAEGNAKVEAKWKPRACRCRVCERQFTPEYRNKRRFFCSDQCSRIALRKALKIRKKPKRWTKLWGAAYEKVDRYTVFMRDGYVCHLCGEKIDPRLRVPNRLAATVDHVVPVTKGGDHTYANLRTAHMGCNSSKGNRRAS